MQCSQRNISYPYGDSNYSVGELSDLGIGETFHTPMGTGTPDAYRNRRASWKHFIPLWGQQPSGTAAQLTQHPKHFIPLWGQQPRVRSGAPVARETFHTPMGTATNAIPVVFCHN